MRFRQRLENAFSWMAVPNLTIFIVVGQVLVWLLQNLANYPMNAISLVPGLVAKGEVWRLFTFVFFPPQMNVLFLIFAWLILFMTGSALEHFWGSFKYTMYVLLGWFLTLLAVVPILFIYPSFPIPNLFITTSIFLAFAYINPNYEFLIFFVLPVKVKWLAVLSLALLGYTFVSSHPVIKIAIAAGIGNYFIFFGSAMIRSVKGAKMRRENRARYESKQVSKAEPFHVCSVCGVTDNDDPNMEFVYSGGKGYCEKCVEKQVE